LLAVSSENYRTDLRENFTGNVPVKKKKLLNFKSLPPLDPDPEIF